MRLVRITTKDPNGRFDGILNADLNLAPGSRIALEQIALEIDPSEINIDPNNSQLTFQQGATTYTGVVEQGLYSVNDGDRLLLAIQTAMNETAEFVPELDGSVDIQGAEYRVEVTTAGSVAFEFRKGEIGELFEDFWTPMLNPNGSGLIVLDSANPNLQTRWGVDGIAVPNLTPYPLALKDFRMPNANCYAECTIYSAAANAGAPRTNPDKSGVWICMTDKDLRKINIDDLQTTLETPQGLADYCRYGVGVDVQAVNGQVRYIQIEKGVASTLVGSASSPNIVAGAQDNPRIRIQRTNYDTIAVNYWDANGQGQPIIISDYDDDTNWEEMYTFVIFWDARAQIQISQLQGCLSSFATDPIVQKFDEQTYDRAEGYGVSSSVKSIYYPPVPTYAENLYQPNMNLTDNFLSFGDLGLANFLGFNEQRIPEEGTRLGRNFNANADTRYRPRLTNETLILLSESIPISSFDTTIIGDRGQGERRSILAVIPTAHQDGRVVYTPNLNFLDINTSSALSLRNLRFRLVDENYNSLAIFGETSMAVLIKEPKEA
jgi:hypothetical protein